MSIEGTTFRKIAFTAGFLVTASVFAGCAFNSLSVGLGNAVPVDEELFVPAANAPEYVAHDETTPAASDETNPAETSGETTAEATTSGTAASETSTEETATEETAENTATPTPLSVKVSFAGDTTLCSDARTYKHFDSVVKKRWDYPFEKCKQYFQNDDLTLVNCEMAITNNKSYRKKAFVFAMKPEGIKYFKRGGIEAVNLANNHTLDFGQSGLKETRKNLTKAGILWSDTSNYSIFTAKNGIKIGMCGYTSTGGLSRTYKLIKTLRSKGCQIVIVSCHWGIEATYKQTKSQTKRGRALINHGADIVVGTHPHRLQPIEVYKGKYILYSIGNFCFGGHTNPSDPDSVIIQCTFVMDETGKKVADYRLNVIPYSLRSSKRGNDYCPKPYAFESKAYDRVMSRLNWAQGDE